MTTDALLTVQDVAQALRVNESTVRRWIQQGLLKAVTLPAAGTRTNYRIPQPELSRLLSPSSTEELATQPEYLPAPSPRSHTSRRRDKASHVPAYLMQLPQDGESYPYAGVDELTLHYHRWRDQQEAHTWLRELNGVDYVVIDTETTGSMRYSQVIEIAILNKEGERLFHSLLKPSTPIEPIATSIHGLSWKDVKDAPTFAEIASDLYPYLQNKLILAYNVSFDIRLLFQTARAFEVPFPLFEAACLMYCYSKVRGEKTPSGQYRRFPLGAACLHMEIAVPVVHFFSEEIAVVEHRAAGDARYLHELLQRLIRTLPQGVNG